VRESSLLEVGTLGPLTSEELLASDKPLAFALEADFDQLMDDREQETEERPGRFELLGGAPPISFPVKVRTRGNFRLQNFICPFPPLRLNFPTDSIAGTTLEGKDKLKLVTHCRDRDSYEQNLLEEYLAYRIYNLLTDISFRVQLALVTYRDTSGKEDPTSRLAFLIEDEETLAERLGGEMLEVPTANPDDFAPMQAGLFYLFQYMIGNTDWSLVHFHNVKLIRIGWEYYPIPYDFDFSGFVDTPYAGPSPLIADRIQSVRERLYWGVCSDRIDYPSLFSHFNARREAILDLIRTQEGLADHNRRSAERYVEAFYEILDDEKDADWKIVSACRRMRGGGS
jgi:hypothetical protein